jgi:hypothetical protein
MQGHIKDRTVDMRLLIALPITVGACSLSKDGHSSSWLRCKQPVATLISSYLPVIILNKKNLDIQQCCPFLFIQNFHFIHHPPT